jgi:tRNA(Ile)-lysidine synthase TilS/MesJ
MTEKTLGVRKLTAEYSLSRRLHRHLMSGIRRFDLIVPGDHLLIGLSGGKDSLALLELLGEAQRRSGGRFRVEALHVRMEGVDYRSDTAYLQAMAEAAGVPLHFRTGRMEADRRPGRTPCFLCSWQRRKILFNEAQRLGCNKLALGHHQDDILRTALMNLTFTGTFSTMPARLEMRKFHLTLVRPLCMVREDDLRAWARYRQYQPLQKLCPHEATTRRTSVEGVLDAMQQLNGEARFSLWHALEKSGALVEKAGAPMEAREL